MEADHHTHNSNYSQGGQNINHASAWHGRAPYTAASQQRAPLGAEQHLQILQDTFKQTANSLTQLYKQSSHSYNIAF